jgi:tetratricopeptide (TPR) repeat protein
MQRIAKGIVFIIAPLALLGLSVAPFLSMLQNNPAATSSQQLPEERIQAEIEGYEAVLEREPENITALQGLVNLTLQTNDMERAIPALTKLQELQPEEPTYPVLLARLQMEQGNYTEAITLLEAQLAEDPESFSLKTGLASVYAQAGQVDQAIQIYDELIAEDTSNFNPILGKAVALSQQLQNQEAQQEAQELFARAIELAPPDQRPQLQEIKEYYDQVAQSFVIQGGTSPDSEGANTPESGESQPEQAEDLPAEGTPEAATDAEPSADS